MIKIDKINNIYVLLVLLVFVISGNVFAQSEVYKPLAEELIGSNGISWVPKVNYSHLELTVARPDGTIFKKEFDSGSSLYISISDILGENYLDGLYSYELVMTPLGENHVRGEERNDGFGNNTVYSEEKKDFSQSGSFTVRGGGIVTPATVEPGNDSKSYSSGQGGVSGTMDQVFADDLIVQNSACVGTDCVNNENFGFDTLRLKENNLRIHFNDTSNSGSFPSNDWRIVINDTSNGGSNYFAIEDSDSSRQILKLMATAPANSIYVSSAGRVGFGTTTPAVDLHKVSGNTPTLRLEQNTSSGFSAQTWDLAGNETNFFLRDVSHSSHLVFRVKPGARENSIFIDGEGDIGLGTASPSASLHVVANGDLPAVYVQTDNTANAEIRAERTGGALTYMSGGASRGFFGTKNNFPLRLAVNDGWVVEVNSSGHYLNIVDGGYYDGNWVGSSSRSLKENIKELNSDDAINALEGLTPVRYNYKKNKTEEHVGFIAEDVPSLVAQNDRKSLSSLDIVAVLTKVLKDQHDTIIAMQKEITELKEKIKEKK